MAAVKPNYEQIIAERQGVDEITALKWAKEQNARIEFSPDGFVVVETYSSKVKRERSSCKDTFIGAVLAIVLKEP